MLSSPNPFRGSGSPKVSPKVSKAKKAPMVDSCKKVGKRTVKFSSKEGMVKFCAKMVDTARK